MMPDTLLQNAEVWTMNERMPYLSSADLLLSGHRLAEITPAGQGPKSDAHVVLDLTGLIVLPGLINAHTHLSLTHLRGAGGDQSLFPWLEALTPAIGKMSQTQLRKSTQAGIDQLLHSGVTCLCDCGPNGPSLVAELGTASGIRTMSGLMLRSNWFGKELVVNVDEAIALTRQLIEQWSIDPGLASFFLGAHSLYTASPELLKRTKQASRDLGVPFNLHLAESKDEAGAIHSTYGESPVVHADSLGLLDEFTIANHCVQLSDEDLHILRARKVRVVHCPSSNARLGSGLARIPELLEAGQVIGLGTDSAASNDELDMFLEMRTAILLQRAYRNDPSALGAQQALNMSTIGAAKALGLQDKIGSLEVGKQADLIAVRPPEPAAASPAGRLEELIFAPLSSQVEVVVVAGNILVDERQNP